VERDAAQWVEKMKALHGELFGPGKTDPLAPVQLEVIDRATDEAVQRLIAAGLLAKATRAFRPLAPSGPGAEPAPLTAEELARVKAHREQAARKLKLARVLGDSGFGEEARPALLEAMLAAGRAWAAQHRQPEPATVPDAFVPPLAHGWGEALPALRAFVENAAADWKPAADILGGLAGAEKG
jgi:hypothetical protein